MAERLKGYIVGSNLNPRGETVWKVRAEDATGRYHRRKFLVVSQSETFTMIPGSNVDFIPAEMDGSKRTGKSSALSMCAWKCQLHNSNGSKVESKEYEQETVGSSSSGRTPTSSWTDLLVVWRGKISPSANGRSVPAARRRYGSPHATSEQYVTHRPNGNGQDPQRRSHGRMSC